VHDSGNHRSVDEDLHGVALNETCRRTLSLPVNSFAKSSGLLGQMNSEIYEFFHLLFVEIIQA